MPTELLLYQPDNQRGAGYKIGFRPPGQVPRKFEVACPGWQHLNMEVLASFDLHAQLVEIDSGVIPSVILCMYPNGNFLPLLHFSDFNPVGLCVNAIIRFIIFAIPTSSYKPPIL